MKEAKTVLLEDIQSHGEDGLWRATIDMQYAVPNARGDFGEEGITGTLIQLKEEGAIKYEKRGEGVDKKTYVIAIKTQ